MTSNAAHPPSLFGNGAPPPSGPGTVAADLAAREARTLLDLMYDGFYLLFLLRNEQAPMDNDVFRTRIKDFLDAVERGAARLGSSAEDVHLCKYAFCATVDETILSSQFKVRDAWQRKPLQLHFFGEQLAGEQFFIKLENLRRDGKSRLQVLEVFHMCLLLGFRGKYMLEGSEKLNYLTKSLGDEIAMHKGTRPPFAPHWAAPDRVAHHLKTGVPLWVVSSVFALFGLMAFIGMRWDLTASTRRELMAQQGIIKPVPQAAQVTITLP